MKRSMTNVARTLPELIKEAAAAYGDGIAVQDGAVQLSYAQLNAAREQVARAFIAAGLVPGDRFAIWAPNMYQWILAAIGGQSVGGVLVPINTRLKGAEAAYILRASGAKLLFTVTDFLDMSYPELLRDEPLEALERIVVMSGASAGHDVWDDFVEAETAVDIAVLAQRQAAVDAGDILDILFTSGTTGKPKGVVTCHGQNIRVFDVWGETVGLQQQDNYLVINPFFHSFGYKAGWLAAFIRGAKVLPVRSFDLEAVLPQIERDAVSMMPGPPTLYQSLLAHPQRDDYDLSSLRLAVTGAAPVPVELVRQMREELGFETVVTAYGLTESCGVVSICRPEDSAQRISHTSGKAMTGVEMKCVDATGELVPIGTEGEIWCRGFNVMRGYLNDAQATAAAITADGWLQTGDIGVMDDDGYVRITDRIKDMFIVGGFNCYPAEIENTLCSMPGVARCAVIGVADERLGEVAMAFIVLSGAEQLDEAAVIGWSRAHMANYKVPRFVQFVDAFPMNAGGKVLKGELRELAAALRVG